MALDICLYLYLGYICLFMVYSLDAFIFEGTSTQHSLDASTSTKVVAQSLPNTIFPQGNTYILTSAIGVTPHSVSVGSSGVSSTATSLTQAQSSSALSTAFTLTGEEASPVAFESYSRILSFISTFQSH